jgi:hypothetical protein
VVPVGNVVVDEREPWRRIVTGDRGQERVPGSDWTIALPAKGGFEFGGPVFGD